MLHFILQWLVLTVAFWITSQVMPGVRVKSFGSAVIVAAIYATLSVLLGWLLFAVFSVGTLGLGYLLSFITWWIIGALMLLLTDKISSRFSVSGFGTALIASALIALFSAGGRWLIDAILT